MAHTGPVRANCIAANGPSATPPRPSRSPAARAAGSNNVITPAAAVNASQRTQPSRTPAWHKTYQPLQLTINAEPLSPISKEVEATLQHVPLAASQPEPLASQCSSRRPAAIVPSTRVRREPPPSQRADKGRGSAGSLPGLDQLGPDAGHLLPAEERKLAKAIQLCKRLDQAAVAHAARSGRLPTALQLAEETGFPDAVAVEEVLRKGWAARQRLVDANRGLVVHQALKLRSLGLELADLIAEGMAALDQAASNFRPDREGGARFSTFAGTAVYRNMLRAVHSYGRVVPLPARMHQTMVQVRKAQRSLRESLRRDPTHQELAAATGMEEGDVLRLIRAFRQPPGGAGGAGGGGRAVSASRGDWEVLEGEEELVSSDAEDWECNDLFTSSLLLDLAEDLQALKPNQRQVVTLRHGLKDCVPRTWKEVGEEMKLTHQRVQKIHAAAIEQLRKQLPN